MVVVDFGQGGGGAELWILIVMVVEWVATLRGFQFLFFYFLLFGCGFYLILAWWFEK